MNEARWLIIALITVLLGLAFFRVEAHEGREVGECLITFGWRNEPAYVGLFNGPEMTIATHDTEAPVRGAEATLKLEVIFGSQSRTLPLEADGKKPGHYIADLIPTRPGDYTFHLTGTVCDTQIDEQFSSADGEFSSVEPVGDILFPDTALSIAELQAQIAELKAMIEALQSK